MGLLFPETKIGTDDWNQNEWICQYCHELNKYRFIEIIR